MTQKLPWSDRFGWISFAFDPSRMSGPMWAVLGECSSKIEHVSGTPLRTDVANTMLTMFVAKGIHATTAIEGNTLSVEQVERRLATPQLSLDLPPTQQYLQQEVDNIAAACNMIYETVEKARGRPFRLTPDELKNFNRTILAKLDLDPGIQPGVYRPYVVTVGDYRAPEAEFIAPMVQQMCDWLNQGHFAAEIGTRFCSAILRAVIAHLYIAWIHPFGDGNGRTARVVEFDILFRAGVPVACCHLLSDHYNRTRSNYYRALSAARQHPLHFVEYAILGLRDSLLRQIDLIRNQQTIVTWNDYIHLLFHSEDDKSAQARRRREIALHLATLAEPVHMDRLTMLTPKIALMYHGKTPRTAQRDVRALRDKGLVIVDDSGIRANLKKIEAFRPFRKEVPSKKAPVA